jgi:hypothetical protein
VLRWHDGIIKRSIGKFAGCAFLLAKGSALGSDTPNALG